MPLIPVYKLLSTKLQCSLLKFMLLRNNISLTLHSIKHSIKSATDTCPWWEEAKLGSRVPLAAPRTSTCQSSANGKTGNRFPDMQVEEGGSAYPISSSLYPLNARMKQMAPSVSKGTFLCIFSSPSRSPAAPLPRTVHTQDTLQPQEYNWLLTANTPPPPQIGTVASGISSGLPAPNTLSQPASPNPDNGAPEAQVLFTTLPYVITTNTEPRLVGGGAPNTKSEPTAN